MKWFRNKEMLQNALKQNKTKSDNTKYLLLDENEALLKLIGGIEVLNND